MITQKVLQHSSSDAEAAYLDEAISALESALMSGDPSKITEVLATLAARRGEIRSYEQPRVAPYDQKVHG